VCESGVCECVCEYVCVCERECGVCVRVVCESVCECGVCERVVYVCECVSVCRCVSVCVSMMCKSGV